MTLRKRPRVGGVAWLENSGGLLTRTDEARLATLAFEARLVDLARGGAERLGLRRERLAGFDPREIKAPDSVAAREAEQQCAHLPRHLVEHSFRTWLWGALLAVHDRVRYDPELLFVASMLHDTGLPSAAGSDGDHNCFTIASVADADELAARVGWPAERRAKVTDAIAMHMNTYVPRRWGAEAYLLNAGAALDVGAVRYSEIPPGARNFVHEAHPRRDFKREFSKLMLGHAATAPRSRAALLDRHGDFADRIEATPYSE